MNDVKTKRFDCDGCGASAYDTPVHPVSGKRWACRTLMGGTDV